MRDENPSLKKSAVALSCRENEIAGNLFTLTSVLSGGVCLKVPLGVEIIL